MNKEECGTLVVAGLMIISDEGIIITTFTLLDVDLKKNMKGLKNMHFHYDGIENQTVKFFGRVNISKGLKYFKKAECSLIVILI